MKHCVEPETVIYIHTVSQADHLVNKLFYLFGPVVFPAIGITQLFRFLKSTFPVFVPEFLNGRTPIGGILWVNHKWGTKGYTAQSFSKARVVLMFFLCLVFNLYTKHPSCNTSLVRGARLSLPIFGQEFHLLMESVAANGIGAILLKFLKKHSLEFIKPPVQKHWK